MKILILKYFYEIFIEIFHFIMCPNKSKILTSKTLKAFNHKKSFPTLAAALQVIIFHVRSLLMSRKTTKSVSQTKRSGLKSRFVRTATQNSSTNPSLAFCRSSSTSNLSPPMTSNSMNHLTDIDSTIASTSVDKRMIQSAMLCKQQLPVVDSCLDLGLFFCRKQDTRKYPVHP